MVFRKIYPEVPPRVEYCLTDTGKNMPLLIGLTKWVT
jgi:DNA-binding HxlR family transcriptional regulator